MADAVALGGLFLFWTSVCFMPAALIRAIVNRGHAQTWSIAALMTFGVAFMGYTRAVEMGTPAEAFAWSVAWAVPVGLSLFARQAPDAEGRGNDVWIGAGAAASFILVLPVMPVFFHRAADFLWAP